MSHDFVQLHIIRDLATTAQGVFFAVAILVGGLWTLNEWGAQQKQRLEMLEAAKGGPFAVRLEDVRTENSGNSDSLFILFDVVFENGRKEVVDITYGSEEPVAIYEVSVKRESPAYKRIASARPLTMRPGQDVSGHSVPPLQTVRIPHLLHVPPAEFYFIEFKVDMPSVLLNLESAEVQSGMYHYYLTAGSYLHSP